MDEKTIFTKEQRAFLDALEDDVIKSQCFDEIERIFNYWLHGTFDDEIFIEKVKTVIEKAKRENKRSEGVIENE